ncbi:MAG: MoaD/ThiS family protein [Gemmatimonadota bacterium]|nr:MoaD/ThiS family protein [Gemmatimonadota bacterium]
MAVTVALPGALRDVRGWEPTIELQGAPTTVEEALEALGRSHPALHARIVTERGSVRPHVNLFVGDEEIRHTGGLETPLGDRSEIVVLPSVSGG